MTTDQTINKTSTIRSARRPSPRPLTTRHSLMRFVTALALALSLVGLPSSPAQADSSPVEFEIISVTVTGPVVRVRFEVPGSCWGWNLNRTSIGNTRIVLAIPGVYKGSEYSIPCPKESFFSTRVFELTNDITELSDNKGKILWSRPGVADFKLRTGKAGTRALKAFVIYENDPSHLFLSIIFPARMVTQQSSGKEPQKKKQSSEISKSEQCARSLLEVSSMIALL